MKDFFEKNKTFIAIIIAAFIIGGFIYVTSLSRSMPGTLQEEIQEEVITNNLRIKSQIEEIEQILLESSNIRIACLVVGVGNYLEKHGMEEEKIDLSKDYEKTKDECSQYYSIYNQIIGLVAEPELSSVKEKLSQVEETLRKFGAYVMFDHGSDGEIIDVYEQDLQRYIIQTKEEILRVRQEHNL